MFANFFAITYVGRIYYAAVDLRFAFGHALTLAFMVVWWQRISRFILGLCADACCA